MSSKYSSKRHARLGWLGAALVAAAIVSALAASVALAATIVGTPRGERLTGTGRADTILARGGNDRVRARGGDDRVYGGSDNDVIAGGRGDDRLYGEAGNDHIFGQLGVDEEWGGPGNDDLWAMAHGDVSGTGDTTADTLHGGPGDDRFHTRDGEADRIDCGEGRDVAFLDEEDVIVDATPANPNGSCEVVVRAEPKPGEDQQENAQQ